MDVYPSLTYRDVEASLAFLEAAFGLEPVVLDDNRRSTPIRFAAVRHGDGMVLESRSDLRARLRSRSPDSLHRMTDDDFLDRFETGRIDEFSHRDHLRMAYAYARRGGGDHAVAMARRGIRRMVVAKGVAAKYHETLTVAWTRVVAHLVERSPADGFDAFLDANPMLLRRDLLLAHYSREQLLGDDARATFADPDLLALP